MGWILDIDTCNVILVQYMKWLVQLSFLTYSYGKKVLTLIVTLSLHKCPGQYLKKKQC